MPKDKSKDDGATADAERIKKKKYEKEISKLSLELVKMQEWIKHARYKLVVVFEGRDAAGKGGMIKTIASAVNPRVCRVVALGTPTEREKTQWYFQRYAAHLPAAGEMVLFDRSWYNRAGVERVMGFCTASELDEFKRSCPEFEFALVRSGIHLLKYWLSISDEVQERRFQDRLEDESKHWKLSPMDVEARSRWVEYSRAKDEMFEYADHKHARWWVVNADDKRRARLNLIHHLLSQVPYKNVRHPKIRLPPRQKDKGYKRPPMSDQQFVPDVY